MWIQLLIPRIEDGNNFGVSIQVQHMNNNQSWMLVYRSCKEFTHAIAKMMGSNFTGTYYEYVKRGVAKRGSGVCYT